MKNMWMAGGLLMLAVGCATTGNRSLMTAASRLDLSSQRFSEDVGRSDTPRENVSSDATALARAAHDFHRSLDSDAGRDSRGVAVDEEFHRVAERYNVLHDHLADAGYAERDRTELRDFDTVTQDFRAVENAVDGTRSSADRTERDHRDRDYRYERSYR
jgi:hypothetical protein